MTVVGLVVGSISTQALFKQTHKQEPGPQPIREQDHSQSEAKTRPSSVSISLGHDRK